MNPGQPPLDVAIACGGTGGHLFPGLAVARELAARGVRPRLLVSPKEVDQSAVKQAPEIPVSTLPAVAQQDGNIARFALASWRSYRAAGALFRTHRPAAVLAMGGFTSAPAVLAGRRCGAVTFLHESNTLPGRANRWLARWVDEVFVGFAEAGPRLASRHVTPTGTPVRGDIREAMGRNAASKIDLGFDPDRPLLLVTGGSQGARGLNRLFLAALPELTRTESRLQILHLCGATDLAEVRAAYGPPAAWFRVEPFLADMPRVLAAADAVLSRAGASSLAEIAALRLPSLLVPLPTAQDDHQRHNAQAFVRAGAALMAQQGSAGATDVTRLILSLLQDAAQRAALATALERLDRPTAAGDIAAAILERVRQPFTAAVNRAARRPLRPATPQTATAR
jgi:UDP-N-acetylglucosamine--N-acetylmuramyl-(pentapeptide) pyrophosphoryl-undecaprenol N-acetylglucosamine transferase